MLRKLRRFGFFCICMYINRQKILKAQLSRKCSISVPTDVTNNYNSDSFENCFTFHIAVFENNWKSIPTSCNLCTHMQVFFRLTQITIITAALLKAKTNKQKLISLIRFCSFVKPNEGRPFQKGYKYYSIHQFGGKRSLFSEFKLHWLYWILPL